MYSSQLSNNFYLLDSLMFEGLIIFVITARSQRLVRLSFIGKYVPFFPLGGFWVFVSGACIVLEPEWYLFAVFQCLVSWLNYVTLHGRH